MIYLDIILTIVILFFIGIVKVRPTQHGLVDSLGKYHHFSSAGFHWIIPIIDRLFAANAREQVVDAEPQKIKMNDNVNALVDARVYFRVKSEEESVRESFYNANEYKNQIVNLTCTTLHSVIGTLTLSLANHERGRINAEAYNTLHNETQNWGIEIVPAGFKEGDPPNG